MQFRDDLEQGSKEWLEWRMGGIGGSDVPAVMGANPEGYTTKRDLFMQKLGLTRSPDFPEYLAYMGHKTEQILRDMYAEKLGIEMKPTCVEFEDFLFCSLDGYNKEHGIAEYKMVGKDAYAKIEKGEVPPHHMYQVQACLLASGAKKAHYCAGWYKTKKDLKSCSIIIEPDEKMQADILKEVKQFVLDMAEMNIPKRTDKDTLFITDKETVDAAHRLEELDKQIKELKKRYDEAKELVIAKATHTKTEIHNLKITKYKQKGSVDYKAIPELKGVDLDQYRKADINKTRLTFKKDEK